MYAGTMSPMVWAEMWKTAESRGMSGATMYAWKKIKKVAAASTRSRRSRASSNATASLGTAASPLRGECAEAGLTDGILELLLADLRRLVAHVEVLLRHLRPDLPHARNGTKRARDLLGAALADHVWDEKLHFGERLDLRGVLALEADRPDPERVEQDSEDAHDHEADREEWCHQPEGSEHHAGDVEEHGDDHVPGERPVAGLAEEERVQHVDEAIAHQDHSRRLDRHVGSGADGDPHVSLRQRRRVVHAVAHHRYLPAIPLHDLDGRDLLRGQQLGLHLVDAEEAAHCLADRPGIAGEHDGVDPACPKLLDQPPRASPR